MFETRAGPRYWATALFTTPLAAVVFPAVAIGFPGQLLGYEVRDVPPEFLLGAMGFVATLCVVRFGWQGSVGLRWKLTPEALVGPGVRVSLFEIDALIVGLPSAPAVVKCVGAANRLVGQRRVAEGLDQARKNVFVLRLRGDRVLPLALASRSVEGGAELMRELSRRLADRVVGPDAYTSAELQAVGGAIVPINRIQRL